MSVVSSSTKTADSVGSEREEVENHDGSGKIARRLRALFCCVRSAPRERVVAYDPDDHDYIVEKLMVRRVPLALVAIRADPGDRHARTRTPDSASPSMSSSAADVVGDPVVRTRRVHGTGSTRTATGRIAYDAAIEAVRFDGNRRVDSLGKRRSLARDTSVASSARTDVSSGVASSVRNNISTRGESVDRAANGRFFGRVRSDRSTERPRQVPYAKNRSDFISGGNRRYIVSPFRVRTGSYDLGEKAKGRGIEDFGVNGKSLARIEKPIESEMSEPAAEALKTRGSPNTAVRWRITVRQQRGNADFESVASEVLRERVSERSAIIFDFFSESRKNHVTLGKEMEQGTDLILSRQIKRFGRYYIQITRRIKKRNLL